MGKNREMIEINMEGAEGLSPLVTWAVKGRVIDFKQELPGMIRESLLVNQQEVGVPMQMIESMSGGAGVDVHLGSGHEEVSVTEAPKYEAPAVVFSAVEEMITEVVQPHSRGGNVDEVIKSVKPEAVIWAKSRDIVVESQTLSASDYRKGVEITKGAEKVVVPQVTRMIPVMSVNEEVAEVTVTELPKYEEITVSDVHLGSGHGQAEVDQVNQVNQVNQTEVVNEVIVMDRRGITEDTEVTEGAEKILEEVPKDQVDLIEVGQEEVITEVTKITESAEVIEGTEIVIFSAVSDQVSALSVIREAFNIELVTEYKQSLLLRNKSVKSVKAKLVWLGKNIANILADQLMGRNTNEPVFGWLVHGLAMMQFDEVEKKQKVKRFKLSPVRVWADRVTKVVKRVKSKFRQSVYGAYNHLFVTT